VACRSVFGLIGFECQCVWQSSGRSGPAVPVETPSIGTQEDRPFEPFARGQVEARPWGRRAQQSTVTIPTVQRLAEPANYARAH
jgi:hypothetical protein